MDFMDSGGIHRSGETGNNGNIFNVHKQSNKKIDGPWALGRQLRLRLQLKMSCKQTI
jgi:hypothetical protein